MQAVKFACGSLVVDVLLFAAFVHAADSYEDEVGLLSKLEILTADEIEDNNMVVTRAWFIDKVSKMFNLPDASESVDEPVFTDVPQSHSQYKGIIAAYEAGLINGNGDGTFSPDSAITLQQATIILVKSLGYSDVLNVCDNLYSQVNNVSKKQGLLNGIAYLNGGGISVDTAVRLIFNTLHANVLDADGVVTGSGSNGMKYAEQDTVLKKYYDILYDEDVVQSDYYYSLTRTTAHKDEIVVGDWSNVNKVDSKKRRNHVIINNASF